MNFGCYSSCWHPSLVALILNATLTTRGDLGATGSHAAVLSASDEEPVGIRCLSVSDQPLNCDRKHALLEHLRSGHVKDPPLRFGR